MKLIKLIVCTVTLNYRDAFKEIPSDAWLALTSIGVVILRTCLIFAIPFVTPVTAIRAMRKGVINWKNVDEIFPTCVSAIGMITAAAFAAFIVWRMIVSVNL